jgi:hypothetical protein
VVDRSLEDGAGERRLSSKCAASLLISRYFHAVSTAPHEHDLVLGYYSVHTSPDALRDAEAHISSIKKRLVQGAYP